MEATDVNVPEIDGERRKENSLHSSVYDTRNRYTNVTGLQILLSTCMHEHVNK